MEVRELVPVQEVASRLGLSRWRTYMLARQGAIPGAVRLGRRVLFRRQVLDAWLAGNEPSRAAAQRAGNCD